MSNFDEPSAPDTFSFPWRGPLIAVFGLMLGIVILFQVIPLPLVLAYKFGVHELSGVIPNLPATLHAHKQLVESVLEQVFYVVTMCTFIFLLKKATRTSFSIAQITHSTFDNLRGKVGRLLTTGVVGYVAATALVVLANVLLPLPKPDSPAGDFGVTLSGLSFAIFAFGTVILAPICEELIFRGFIFNMLRASLRKGWIGRLNLNVADWLAIVFSAAFFAGMHHTASGFPELFIIGMVLAYVYRRTNNLYASMAVHFVNNLMATVALFLAIYH